MKFFFSWHKIQVYILKYENDNLFVCAKLLENGGENDVTGSQHTNVAIY